MENRFSTNTASNKELEESLIKFQNIRNFSSTDIVKSTNKTSNTNMNNTHETNINNTNNNTNNTIKSDLNNSLRVEEAEQIDQIDVDHHDNLTHKPNAKDLKDLLLEELSEYYQTKLSYNCDFSIYIARKYYTIAMVLFSLLSLFVKVVTNSFPNNHNVSLIFSFYRLISLGSSYYFLMLYKISNHNKPKKPENRIKTEIFNNKNSILLENSNKIKENFDNIDNIDEFDETHTIKIVDLFDKKLIDINKTHSRWLLLRIISLIISNTTTVIALNFLKLEIFGLISLTLPIFVNILSTVLIKEKFHNKYLIACLICIIGGYYALKKPENNNVSNLNKENLDENNFLGIIFGLIMVANIAFTNFLQSNWERTRLIQHKLLLFYLGRTGHFTTMFNNMLVV